MSPSISNTLRISLERTRDANFIKDDEDSFRKSNMKKRQKRKSTRPLYLVFDGTVL